MQKGILSYREYNISCFKLLPSHITHSIAFDKYIACKYILKLREGVNRGSFCTTHSQSIYFHINHRDLKHPLPFRNHSQRLVRGSAVVLNGLLCNRAKKVLEKEREILIEMQSVTPKSATIVGRV